MRNLAAILLWLIWSAAASFVGISLVKTPGKFFAIWAATTALVMFYIWQGNYLIKQRIKKH